MKVIFTESAIDDLRGIGEWTAAHYPAIALQVEQRIRHVVARLGRWPESGPRSAKREGVRVVPVGRYPYKIFYRVTAEAVEILHIHHVARRPVDEEP
jgi:plasmid stabilization system protein ParE